MKWDWNTFLIKLTSRKLWMAIAAFVSALLLAFGGTESEAAQVTGLIMAGASVIAYIIGEGLIDAAREGSEVIVELGEETE
jgi:hypothetical protein